MALKSPNYANQTISYDDDNDWKEVATFSDFATEPSGFSCISSCGFYDCVPSCDLTDHTTDCTTTFTGDSNHIK